MDSEFYPVKVVWSFNQGIYLSNETLRERGFGGLAGVETLTKIPGISYSKAYITSGVLTVN
ncbi:MAG: hypothetical protein V7K89_06685 [Nostoc sp.]|uniref:hypothetical protein n=1 Tax=Nostoc sp. TaxID=1180 RepID=UPI002FFA6D4E